MPLVILTGLPSSGKTTVAEKLREYLSSHGKEVTVVSEEELLSDHKNVEFAESRNEKEVRGRLKSEVIRVLNKDSVTICDGLNYIKGFRYELYCASKSLKTNQVTVHCDVSAADAQVWNSCRPPDAQYTQQIFSALCERYEAPVGSNRWDSPLFLVLKDGEVDCSGVFDGLFRRAPPPPNQSTQSQPLSSTDFVYQLDKQTQEIVARILEAQKMQGVGSEVVFSQTSERFVLAKSCYTLSELARIKRQFITYTKMGAVQDVSKLSSMFVQYLRSNLIC